jgi:hypothetical protein
MLSEAHTVWGDTLGAVKLAQYLAARDQKVEFSVNGDFDLRSSRDRNVILIGSPTTSRKQRA